MQKGALVLVVGASGAGKDTLIGAARAALGDEPRFLFPRRVVTREAMVELEDHDSVDPAEFDRQKQRGAYALDWEAHGLSYGVPASIDAAMAAGGIVVVNTSRRVIEQAVERYPNCHVLLVAAEPAIRARAAGVAWPGDRGAGRTAAEPRRRAAARRGRGGRDRQFGVAGGGRRAVRLGAQSHRRVNLDAGLRRWLAVASTMGPRHDQIFALLLHRSADRARPSAWVSTSPTRNRRSPASRSRSTSRGSASMETAEGIAPAADRGRAVSRHRRAGRGADRRARREEAGGRGDGGPARRRAAFSDRSRRGRADAEGTKRGQRHLEM